MEKQNRKLNRAAWFQITLIIILWALAAWFVDPTGEFMINDDWCYVKCLEAFQNEGRLIQVGWGEGGPALITHLLWGDLFSRCFGFSLTTLRISTVIMGVTGTLALFMLLRLSGVSMWFALMGTLTLMFNPLFFSQSFTFMTDVTFTSLAAVSMLFLCLGVHKTRMIFVVAGLLFALLATLTRQLGIVIPLGFMGACFLHKKADLPGRSKLILLSILIAVLPWLLVEYLLFERGGPSILDFQGIARIVNDPREKGLWDYPFFLLEQFFYNGLCYGALLISPVLAIRLPRFLTGKGHRRFLWGFTIAFLLFEAALICNIIDPPTPFYRNVIIDFGIGPLLLKDTYILGATRLTPLPKPLYYLCIYWAVLCGYMIVSRIMVSLKRMGLRFSKSSHSSLQDSAEFVVSFTFLNALIYLGIITLSGFHDRYLIPLCLFLIVWTLSDGPLAFHGHFRRRNILFPCTLLLLMAGFSVTGTRDFLETKRHVKQALDFAVNTLRADPCNMDGGFEFNGYHCSSKDFSPVKGLSWWWVSREKYLITLGPLQGYETIQTFPFVRHLGQNGAVHLLQPIPSGN